MMSYYDGRVNRYFSEGEILYMTEEQAEAWQEVNRNRDLTSDTEIPKELPDEVADDAMDCTCLPDPPDGNQTASLCRSCRLYFASLGD